MHNEQLPVTPSSAAYRFPAIDAAIENASSPHYPGGATTAYTGLLSLDETTLLLTYDRLANGWGGPPGKMGRSDMVFSMTVKIMAEDSGGSISSL